jgi:GTP cyclohydrolase I
MSHHRARADATGTSSPATLLAWRPAVTHKTAGIDLVAGARATGALLAALGHSVESGGIAKAPLRMAHADAELLSCGRFDLTMFANTAGDDFHSHRAQTQERPTKQISEHPCTSLRGVKATGARTFASALWGPLRTDPSSGDEFPSPVRLGQGW